MRVRHFLGGGVGESDHQQLVDVAAPRLLHVADQRHAAFGQHRGFARPGGCGHEQATAGLADGLELGGRESAW